MPNTASDFMINSDSVRVMGCGHYQLQRIYALHHTLWWCTCSCSCHSLHRALQMAGLRLKLEDAEQLNQECRVGVCSAPVESTQSAGHGVGLRQLLAVVVCM